MFSKWKSRPKYGYVILVLLCIGIAVPNFGQFQVSTLAEELRSTLDLSQSQFSTIATAPLLAGILLGFLSGILMDRFGIRVVTAALILSSAGCVLRVFAEGFWLLYLSGILIGFAATFVNSTTPKIVGVWFPPERITQIMGIVLAIGNLAMGLGSGTAAQFGSVRRAFGFTAGFSLVFLALWLLFIAEKPQNAAAAAPAEERVPIGESLRAVLKSRKVWMCSFICLGCTAGIGAVSVFLPQALMSRGMPAEKAGWLSMVVTLGNMTTSFVTPTIIRVFATNRRRLRGMLFAYALGAAVLIAFSWRASGALLPILLFVTGFCGMGFTAFLQSLPAHFREIGHRYAGSATGFVLTLQLTASVVLPSYVIAPIAGENYRLLFLLLGTISLIAVALSFFLPADDLFAEKTA